MTNESSTDEPLASAGGNEPDVFQSVEYASDEPPFLSS
jgi:hypothetical protein